jgi:hypothetical protein
MAKSDGVQDAVSSEGIFCWDFAWVLHLLICLSCFFYLLILRKRGKLRNNKILNNVEVVKVKKYFESTNKNLEVILSKNIVTS